MEKTLSVEARVEKWHAEQRALPKPAAWMFFFENGEASGAVFESEKKANAWRNSEECLWEGYIAPVYIEPGKASQKLFAQEEDEALLQRMLGALAAAQKHHHTSSRKQAIENYGSSEAAAAAGDLVWHELVPAVMAAARARLASAEQHRLEFAQAELARIKKATEEAKKELAAVCTEVVHLKATREALQFSNE